MSLAPVLLINLSTGCWSKDLSNDFPEAGVFIAAKSAEFFPHSPPDKTTFIVQDFTRPWPDVLLGKLDVVHQRLALLAQGPSLRIVLAGLGSLLKSNGWIQFAEMDNSPVSSNGTAWPGTRQVSYERSVCFNGGEIKLQPALARSFDGGGI